MRRPRTGELVAAGSGVAEALRSRPRASVTGDAGVLAMCTAVGGSWVPKYKRALVRATDADGASDPSYPRRAPDTSALRFPRVDCCVFEAMAAGKEGKEDAMATERSGTGSATMQSE